MTDLKTEKPEGAFPADSGAAANLLSMPTHERLSAYLHARLAQDADDEDAALLLMDLYNIHEMTDSGEVWALSRLERHPNSALWQSLLSEALRRSHQATRAQEYLKDAYRNSPYCARGWGQELTRLTQSAGAEAVLDFLAKSPKELHESREGLAAEMAKLAQAGRRDESQQVFAKLEAGVGDYDYAMAGFLASMYMFQGRKKEAVAAWTKLLKYGHDYVGAYTALAALYQKAGDLPEALDALKEAQTYVPDNTNLYLEQARVLMHQKKWSDAEKPMRVALALSPYNSVVMGQQGTLRSLSGDSAGAKDILRRSVESNYNDFPSWDKLRSLDGRPTFESLAPLPNVDSLIAASASWEGRNRDRGSVLSYIEDVFFYPSRAVKHRTFLVAYLPTQDAVNAWKEYSIGYNSTYQTLGVTRAYTRKAKGSEVDAEYAGLHNLIFKSLEPGDCVVIEWTLKDGYDGEMARQAWGGYDFRIGLPVFDSRLRLFEAGADTVAWTMRGKDMKLDASEKGDVKLRVFSRGPYAPPINERYLPSTDETSPDVIYSTFPDWARISDWYANLTDSKTAPAPILRKTADSLFAGAKTAAEKIARVHAYVTGNIAYSSLPFRQSAWVPQSSHEVIASRLGDCKDMAALAKSLLALGGVESHLVLVATRDEFGTRPGPVGPAFNHCILSFKLDGKTRYMDLTDPDLDWAHLPKYDQGSQALVIERGNRNLIRLPVDKAPDRRVSRRIQCSLSDSGSAQIDALSTRTGIFARGIRDSFRFLNAEERKETMLRFISNDYPDVVLDSLWFGDLSPATDSVQSEYRFRGRQAVKTAGPTRIFALYLPDRIFNDDVPDDQPHPSGVDLYNAWFSLGSYSISGTVAFPAKWKLLSLPAPVKLKSSFGEYNLVFKLKGNTLAYTRTATVNLGEPVIEKDVTALRGFLNQVAKSDDVQLVFMDKGK